MLALPDPMRGGQLADLRKFVNVEADEDWLQLEAWLVASIFPRGPNPICCFRGGQGSAKSTQSCVLRALVDPNSAPLRAVPREIRDLMIAANNGWIVAADNLSNLPEWLSDAICRLSTGGGFSARGLYTDDEEKLFESQRPVILNSIVDIATRPDLLDRSIFINSPDIEEGDRKPEKRFWAEFEDARPAILGALLDAAATAMANLPTTKLDRLPRMADFALLATAPEPAFGCAPHAFMAAYNQNRADANALALEASPVPAALDAFLCQISGSWEGTATELLEWLELLASDEVKRRTVYWRPPERRAGGRRSTSDCSRSRKRRPCSA
jgi:hypothetical protein